MKFWLENQVSAEYDADIDDLAKRYWQSSQGRQMLDPSVAFPLERSLHIQEANPDHLERSMRAIRSAQEDLSQLSRAQGEVS